MGLEREIKLTAPHPAALEAILADPALLALVPAGEKLRDHSFEATYVDSPDLALLGRKWALRFRLGAGGWTMGLKGHGDVQNGISQREEVEESFNAASMPTTCATLPRGEIAARLAAWLPPATPLVPLLVTRVTRRALLLHPAPGVVCELAADWGEVEAGGKKLPLCEVELESLAGPLEPLLDLARELMTRHPLAFAHHSKFTLGLSLLGWENAPG